MVHPGKTTGSCHVLTLLTFDNITCAQQINDKTFLLNILHDVTYRENLYPEVLEMSFMKKKTLSWVAQFSYRDRSRRRHHFRPILTPPLELPAPSPRPSPSVAPFNCMDAIAQPVTGILFLA